MGDLAAPTGHAPSLDVLTKLAELYECRVADLLLDCADFRSGDSEYLDGTHLDALPELVSLDTRSTGSVTDLIARLESIDVHEVARLTASWASQTGSALSSRDLLLKLSAGLSLAAARISQPDTPEVVTSRMASVDDLSGIWHSRYVYPSSGRGRDFIGEHYVVLRHKANQLIGQSLPHSTGSQLRLDLALDSLVATGTWREQTSNEGYYRGAIYHGSIQMLIEPSRQTMRGMWLGFGRDFKVNNGRWELTRETTLTSRSAQRDYLLKA